MLTPEPSAPAARLEAFLGYAYGLAGRTPYAPVTETLERKPSLDTCLQMLRCWGLPDYGLPDDQPAFPVRRGEATGGR
ncbi:hypothetical protein [Streptomyces sp. NPDC049915]|uniref:hypothetical protein n=1 Tax=Streptomyces sp. NPDC049915 TaxID=3155510 RepID=UPI0034205FAE